MQLKKDFATKQEWQNFGAETIVYVKSATRTEAAEECPEALCAFDEDEKNFFFVCAADGTLLLLANTDSSVRDWAEEKGVMCFTSH